MFRFADVPLSLSGMTRIPGRRVFLRAPTMDDWAGMGRIAGPQPGLSHAVGTDLARGFAGPRPFPPPAAPAGPRMAGGRGLRPVRLPQRQAPAGRRHQPQQRAPRRRPGGLGRLLDGPALCRPGADDRRACARSCPSCSTSSACTGSRPPACRTTSPPRAVLAKVGFHEEGLARQYLRINGQWADHLLFALLRADYDTLLRAAR